MFVGVEVLYLKFAEEVLDLIIFNNILFYSMSGLMNLFFLIKSLLQE